MAPSARTDDGNALRLIEEHGDRIRRVADMKRWFEWDGKRWAMDHDSRAVREAARELARLLPETDKAARTFKHASMSATGISGCVRVAETDQRVSVLADSLDSHPELINTPSGVVNLRTGTISEHDPSLSLTRITACPVALDAPHPTWDKFLAETFQGDQDMVSYVQRIAGLALLGGVRDHILPFLHGTGRNGKGALVLVLQGLLGDADQGGYSVSAPDGFLMAGRDGKHETEVARLRGARLVVCSEQTSGKKFDEAKVKKMTGGDRLTGRFMRGDFFDFNPSHLLLVLSNHLPQVQEGGPAFWARVRLIPFLHVVPAAQQVPDLHNQLLADEGAAIMGWAVKGAVDVLAGGLRDPEKVTVATHKYEISEDTLASFIENECERGEGHSVTVTKFRAQYEQHCREMDAEPLSQKGLSMRLASEFGVITGKRDPKLKARIYSGIRLSDSDGFRFKTEDTSRPPDFNLINDLDDLGEEKAA
jgi:putative DNA primase/helicase